MKSKNYAKFCLLLVTVLLLATAGSTFVNARVCKLRKGMHLHHVFPREFDIYFRNHGINIHIWTIPLEQRTHNAIHKMGYNRRWGMFIAAFPSTTQTKIFGHAAELLVEAGIRGRLKTYDFRTRKCTGKSFPPKHIIQNLRQHLRNFIKNPKTVARLRVLARGTVVVGSLVLAYEAYQILASMDDNFRDSKYVQMALDSYVEAIELNEKKAEEAAVEKIGEAYYFLGYACFHKYIEYRSQYFKEIADLLTEQSDRYLNQSEEFFKKAIKYNGAIGYSYFYLGKIYKIKGQREEAKAYFLKASELFQKEDNGEFLSKINEEMEKL